MLYALLDMDTLKRFDVSIEEFIEACYELEAKIIQYRDKHATLKEKEKNLLKIRNLWDKTLIINDSIELMDMCDGVHIGQEDLDVLRDKSRAEFIEDLRKRGMVGLSTHNEKEVLEANNYNLSYIGLGAYRPTNTKDTSNILGDKIFKIAKLSTHPVAIIGGVRLDDDIKAYYKVVGSDICRFIKSR